MIPRRALLAVAVLLLTSMSCGHRSSGDASSGRIVELTTATPSSLNRPLVVLVHGLDEPGTIWLGLTAALKADRIETCEFRYPNDGPIATNARSLAAELTRLRSTGVAQVDLVAHSMGGLLCREALTAPDIDRSAMPAVRRLIMVATPNHGSELARFHFASEAREQVVRWYRGTGGWLAAWVDGRGEASDDLLPDSAFLTALNARPLPSGVAISIIAGDRSPVDASSVAASAEWMGAHLAWDQETIARWRRACAALSDGTGDGAVALESTRLEGVADQVVLHANHISLLEGSGGEQGPAIDEIRVRLEQGTQGMGR